MTSDLCSAPCSPHYSILGRISNTDVYRDVAEYEMVTAPGVGGRAACNEGAVQSIFCSGSLEKGAGGIWMAGREGGKMVPSLG